MITALQVRAARSILEWSQAELAERTGVTQATIANIEIGKHLPSKGTIISLMRTFEGAGIELLPDGVRKLKGVRELTGENAVIRLFEDVFFTLRDTGGDLLISGADERKNPPGLERVVMKIRDARIRMRALVEEGNTHLLAPLEEYRCVPARFFSNHPTVIYGDRVAIYLPEERRPVIQIITNAALAHSQRLQFEFIWTGCPGPLLTTAVQAYPPYQEA